MLGITIFYVNQLNRPKRLENETICYSNSKIIFQHRLENDSIVFLQLLNPFNYIIYQYFLTSSSPETVTFFFNEYLPSGRYFIKLLMLKPDQEGTDSEQKQLLEYRSIQFSGSYSSFDWLVTYAVNLTAKRGMDIRLAAPKQYFPFFLVESLEGRPSNTFTTDVWSTWLIFNTASKMGTNSIMFGYQSIVHTNYMIFSPDSLSKVLKDEKTEFYNFLMSEPGIETTDSIIQDFAKKIHAKTVFGVIHQALYEICQYLTFKEQPGEFGAKYAILNKQGDCTEYAALFTALCRIKNLPSRLVAGLKRIKSQNQSNWIRHAWSEIYYEGLWIPIDVVEGKSKIIGFHPDLIPLFKGNWMADNMNREIKVSILEEFKHDLNTNDLLSAYSSLNISFKISEIKNSDINKKSQLNNHPSIITDLVIKEEQEANSNTDIVLKFDHLEKNNIVGLYYKADTNKEIKSPKMVFYLEQFQDRKENSLNIKTKTPENPGLYEIGVFITSSYGELIGLFSTFIDIIT